ncbi:MAG: hypothetical protein QM775_35195 [Pirellulales bacterium]
MHAPRFSVALILATFAAASARGDVRLPAIFSDHMVVQAEKPVAVWGWAEPGEAVAVELGEVRQETKAAADGTWRVTLGPLKPQAAPQRWSREERTS